MSGLTTEVETMELDSRYAADAKLFVVFSMQAVQNGFKTEQEGRPIFDTIPHIRIHIPGDKNSVVDRPVEPQDKQRFSARWEAFQKGMQVAEQGTPLEAWPALSVGQVMEFKAAGVFNVEQLAEMADNHAQRFMGGNELRRKAQTFLKVSKDTAEAQRLATANAELAGRLEAQDAMMRDMAAQIRILQEAKSAPPASTLKGQVDGDAQGPVRRGPQ